MTDVADDIRKAVAETRVGTAPPAAFRNQTREPDEDFMKLRAHVRGTMIAAKHQLVPGGEWLVTDDRILDVITAWLENNRR
jgi:hypothetical protein